MKHSQAKRRVILIGSAIIILLILYAYHDRKNASDRTTEIKLVETEGTSTTELKPEPTVEVEEKGQKLDYSIVKTENVGYAGVARQTYRILLNVTEIPSEEDVKATAIAIWENGNKGLDEFTVFVYLPEMKTDHAAYAVCEFRPSGLQSLKVSSYATYGTKWE